MHAQPSRLFSREFLVAAFVAATGFFVLGYGAILIMPPGNSAAVIWPATAFAACVILRHARGWTERSVMLAGVAVADVLNNGLGGDRLVMTIGYSLINVLELAIALANEPRLLLMDEPTAGMAPRERNDLMALTRSLVIERRIAVLFTEHSMVVVFAHADRMIVLARGRLIAQGKPAAVREDPLVKQVYFGTGATFAPHVPQALERLPA